MSLSHTKRLQKRARLSEFKRELDELRPPYAWDQHTKYHYSFTCLDSDGAPGMPVQAYPTTLRVVDGNGTSHDCLTVSDMFTTIYVLLTPGEPS